MIKLKVAEYCSECPDFEPSVDKKVNTAYVYDLCCDKDKVISSCNTIVSCEHADRCECIKIFLEEKEKGNGR